MPTGPRGGSWCGGRWPSSSAGTAPARSTSPCIGGRWPCGRRPLDRERGGVRPRAPQSPAVRPQSRPLAPRQRLAVRGRAGHVSPSPGAARGAGRRGDPDSPDDRLHTGAREPAGESDLRPRNGDVLHPAPGRLRRSARGAQGVRRCGARAPRGLLAVAAHPAPGPVPENRRKSRLRFSPSPGAGSSRDHGIRRHARLPAAARPGRKHPAAARGGSTGAPAPVRSRAGRPPVAALVRDPRSSMQSWSRHQGYPGDEWYLEFHKIRWPGGLKLWRVTGATVDLGGKRAYEPPIAHERATGHASHFAHLLQSLALQQADRGGDGVIVAPFDTELFGHWWFEGADFLAATYRALRGSGTAGEGVRAVTASQHLDAHPASAALQLAEGSWGANGDHTMWLNERTAWTWDR